MNTKNNRRRRESIERIEKAFLELLQTKELHEITVSDICKSCELNRSTFYANYIDIFDLADKTIKGIRILRDNSGKFKDAINKFNVSPRKKSHPARKSQPDCFLPPLRFPYG